MENYEMPKLCDMNTLIKRLQVASSKCGNPTIAWVSKDEGGVPELVYAVGAGAYCSVSLGE